MPPILHAGSPFGGRARVLAYLCLFVAISVFASCHPRQSQRNSAGQSAALTAEDSLLGAQFPLEEYYHIQKELLLKHSKRAKDVIVPDGKHLAGNFNSGAVELTFDEIDGEPNYFYGHLEQPYPQARMEFIIYDIPNAQLDRLVPGQKYRLHWIETVVNTAPFDDDRYRSFLTYRIDE